VTEILYFRFFVLRAGTVRMRNGEWGRMLQNQATTKKKRAFLWARLLLLCSFGIGAIRSGFFAQRGVRV
jgi:hypothetical protein